MVKLRTIHGDEISVGNVYGVARNYALHARELNNPLPEEPVIFLKTPRDLTQEELIRIPRDKGLVHYETELVLVLKAGGRNLEPEAGKGLIGWVAVGIDVTLRDVQTRLRQKGLPWTLAKHLDQGAPLSPLFPLKETATLHNLTFALEINGEIRQQGNSADMIFSPGKLISFMSGYFTLSAGDLIFTGTPEGVGELHPGDRLRLFLAGKEVASFSVID